jgi:hypothetical protein
MIPYTHYKRLRISTGKIDTCRFDAAQGAPSGFDFGDDSGGMVGYSEHDALCLVNEWNQRAKRTFKYWLAV